MKPPRERRGRGLLGELDGKFNPIALSFLTLGLLSCSPHEPGDSLDSVSVGLPWWLRIRLQCKRPGFDPWVRKIPGGEHGNPLQYSCLEKSMDRGTWWAAVHRVASD